MGSCIMGGGGVTLCKQRWGGVEGEGGSASECRRGECEWVWMWEREREWVWEWERECERVWTREGGTERKRGGACHSMHIKVEGRRGGGRGRGKRVTLCTVSCLFALITLVNKVDAHCTVLRAFCCSMQLCYKVKLCYIVLFPVAHSSSCVVQSRKNII